MIDTFPQDYTQHNEVIVKLREGLDLVRHYQKFYPKRIEKKLAELLPLYTVRCSDDGHFARVAVWGNGLAYDKKIDLSWISSNYTREAKTWQEKFAEDLDRNDLSDYAERQEQLMPHLAYLADLENRMQTIREEAAKKIAALPIPTSAKMRSNECFWNNAPCSLAEKFPLLFKTRY
jgi:hypothetical protein